MGIYIKRSMAVKAFMNAEELYDPEWGNKRFSLTDVEEILNGVEPADVRPVKQGEWQEGQFKYLTCSECGCDTNLYDQNGFPIGQRKGHPYPCFCPHCGADMTGGADNG